MESIVVDVNCADGSNSIRHIPTALHRYVGHHQPTASVQRGFARSSSSSAEIDVIDPQGIPSSRILPDAGQQQIHITHLAFIFAAAEDDETLIRLPLQ